MVNINLVPEKIRSAETLKIIVVLGSISLLIPVAFWAFRYQSKRAELAEVEKQVSDLREELASPKLKQVVDEVAQFTKDQGDLDSKRSIVDLLRKRQVVVVRFLDLLPDIVPRYGRVGSLKITEEKGVEKVELEIEYKAVDAPAAIFESLEASPIVVKPEVSKGPETKKLASGLIVDAVQFKFDLQAEPQ